MFGRPANQLLGGAPSRTRPAPKARSLLRHNAENLSERQAARIAAVVAAGDPEGEVAVAVAYGCYQLLRSTYTANPIGAGGRTAAETILDTFHACPFPEVSCLGRTLRSWREQLLTYFTTDGVSNGGIEAINLQVEKARRLAHGYRYYNNYRLRLPLAAGGTRPYRRARPTT